MNITNSNSLGSENELILKQNLHKFSSFPKIKRFIFDKDSRHSLPFERKFEFPFTMIKQKDYISSNNFSKLKKALHNIFKVLSNPRKIQAISDIDWIFLHLMQKILFLTLSKT
jgi:hypothetical protein